MDNSTIAMIATVVLSLLAVFGVSAIFLKGTRIIKEAVDVVAAAFAAMQDMKVSAEEVAAVRREFEEFKQALAEAKAK